MSVVKFPVKQKLQVPEDVLNVLSLNIFEAAEVFLRQGYIQQADDLGKAAYFIGKVATELRILK